MKTDFEKGQIRSINYALDILRARMQVLKTPTDNIDVSKANSHAKSEVNHLISVLKRKIGKLDKH